jgi:hypothetical protein
MIAFEDTTDVQSVVAFVTENVYVALEGKPVNVAVVPDPD